MDAGILDVEHLQQISYERSRTWATFLESVKKKNSDEELPLSELEELIGKEYDEADSNDELASMEDVDEESSLPVESELLKNFSNVTRLSILLNKSVLALPESATKEQADIVDLVNQTLPIIHEHNRQLKETGFDRILNTFDKNKIEEKVGSWLNRHNSLYGGDSTMAIIYTKSEDNKSDKLTGRKENKRKASNSHKSSATSEEESSDDSLQSGETARYIRSSRAGSFKKNAASSKTMIKTYRMVKSTRDTLREKYACEDDNNDVDDYHLNAICYRRKITDEYEYEHNNCHLTRKKTRNNKNLKHTVASTSKQKRKVLRKRRVIQSHISADLSDSDFYEAEHSLCRNLALCCNTNHRSTASNTCPTVRGPSLTVKRLQRSLRKTPLARPNRRYYCFQKLTKSLSQSSSSSSSSSMSSSTGSSGKSLQVKMKHKSSGADTKPYKRISECGCHNERQLCGEFRHVEDASTNDWIVENDKNEEMAHQDDGNVEKTARKDKTHANKAQEETFFAASQIKVICNSTAVSSNSPAYNRQFVDSIRLKQHQNVNTPNGSTKQGKTKNIAKQKSSTKSKKNISPSIKKTILAQSKVTSTTIRASPDLQITSSSSKRTRAKCPSSPIDLTDSEQNDCTLVTSTTNNNLLDKTKGILIYTPNNPSSQHPTTDHSINNGGYFTITKKHLSGVIGEKLAEKFLKYYVGRRRFNVNSTIYYIPPKTRALDNNNISTSSESDDCLDNLGQFGDLYECL